MKQEKVDLQEQIQIASQEEIKWTSTQLSEILQRNERFDAAYFNAEGKVARRLIENCTFDKLYLNSENGFAKVWHRPRFRRIFIDNGIPIYTSSQILEFNPKTDKYVSNKTDTDLTPLYLQEGQIVMTCSGSVGYTSLVTQTLNGRLFSHDLLRIEPYQKSNVGYIYAFLKSRIGQILVTTNNYGSVVTHLEPEHLSSLSIPNPSDKFKLAINSKIMKAFELRDNANTLIANADKILSSALNLIPLNELKPKYFVPDEIRNFEVKTSDLDLRFEANYHTPLLDEIDERLKNSNVDLTTVGDKRVSKDVILPGRFKRIYVETEYGVPFLGGRDITQFDPPELDYLSLKGHAKRIAKELTLSQNMLLITCSGTIGNTLLVPKYLEGWTASQHIIRIVPADSFNAGYLYAFLSSDYGYQLIKRNTYGSVVDEINDDQVSNITIPLLKPEKMDEIGNFVLKANELRSEAWFLEKEAIRDVENLIKDNQK